MKSKKKKKDVVIIRKQFKSIDKKVYTLLSLVKDLNPSSTKPSFVTKEDLEITLKKVMSKDLLMQGEAIAAYRVLRSTSYILQHDNNGIVKGESSSTKRGEEEKMVIEELYSDEEKDKASPTP
ncbi:hypothetical protein L2E82_11599 [Cichorium intybus]|uniref:Uncharacterized protein n=1 Tax=Cichorium intybus TaxID=13427 RepID=A0ACB9GED6_CICIN|nr:hypothetical protein L2E82_11599 [Cichorium intybus]